jgi:hypothetical protein
VINVMRRISADVGLELLENEERNGGDEYSFFQVYRKRRRQASRISRSRGPAKSAAIVRPGVYGDSLWASSTAYHLKREGYHVTVYTESRARRSSARSERGSAHRDGSHYPAGGALWPVLGGRGGPLRRWVNLVEICETRLLVRRSS